MQRPEGDSPLDRVRTLRRSSTEAEQRLWAKLRGRRLAGAKFRRQVWLAGYIADFYCAESKLIVEADGSQHAEAIAYDERRRQRLEQAGFKVLRFWNNDIMANLDGVLTSIEHALSLPPLCERRAPPSPLQGEG
jgi:very-short-patch-repair endonuclease